MTILEDRGEASAVVIAGSEQPSRPGVGRAGALGSKTREDFEPRAGALGSKTREDFGRFRAEMAEASEVAAHFHRTFSESFYVLTGRLEPWNGDAWSAVAAGDLAYVPRGGVHGLRVSEGRGAHPLRPRHPT